MAQGLILTPEEAEAEIDIRARLAKEILRRRQDLGMTQQQYADHAGICRTAINSMERMARTPSIGTLARLARATGMSLDPIFGIEVRP